ncbi:Aminoglycoside phosphotransferase [Kalmanozyma brasiliensis GHG001]|uniref:Aminoglycoside phosphotransferase n=1 Tax=Kalmanozyma brasiliensis (strain GHG001) TaxID=1365824 RepID=UPI0028683925|nr:Aminoglycoside phosphotransferase [Kalmanozyma brasiliensis GHG001]KAF6767343.1 Aminoglycoside phosphotransferase [Kalmanozyma brasiliensis GHG001]
MLKPIPIPTTKTDETDRIVYHDTTIDGRRCIVKRNKSHSEFAIDPNTHEVVAFANLPNCIRNEKAAMDFVRANTCIPVPEVLFYLDEGDRVLLGVEVVEGIKMDEIQDERDRAKVIEQLDGFVEQLAQHRSPKIKGFAAKACFSLALTDNLPRCSLKFVEDHDQGYPLCHGDLHQSNIIVDPETKKAKAVLDWEYCGYYPDECEPRRYKAGVKDVVCPDGSIVKYRKWGEKAFEALKKYTVDSDDDEWLARRADRHLSQRAGDFGYAK